MKRIINVLLLMFALLLSNMYIEAEAATSGTCGYDLTWNLNEATGKLTISGTGRMENYGDNRNVPWPKESVKSVVMENGVTYIGASAFCDCTQLTSVTIPDSVTEISSYVFSGCKSLISVEIPDGVARISGCTFAKCTSLTSVTIPDSVTKIGSNAFSGCVSLTKVTLPDSITSIDYHAFSGCTALTSVKIPDGVTSIQSNTFRNCTDLTEVTISGSVTCIRFEAFLGCTSLTSVTIPSSVTTLEEYAFKDCTSLSTVAILGDGISIGEYVFSGCNSLDKVILSDSVSRIGQYAFAGCSSLTKVSISKSNDNDSKVTSSDTAAIDRYAFKGCSSLLSVEIPKGIAVIEREAFSDCSALIDVMIPDSITSIGVRTFQNCSSLQSAMIPGSVTIIDQYAFAGCSSLGNVMISDGVTLISYGAFENCVSLTEISIPDSVTRVMDKAFWSCKKLEKVKLSESMSAIYGYLFENCESLKHITIPASVKKIYCHAFRGTGLESIRFLGSAPKNGDDFYAILDSNSNLTAYYPIGDSSWTETVRKSYGGYKIKWAKCCTGEHQLGEWEVIKSVTYTYDGQEGKFCKNCEYVETRIVPMLVYEVPTLKVAVDEGTGKPKLTWTHHANSATEYQIYRASSKKGKYTRIADEVYSSSFIDTTAEIGEEYHYKFRGLIPGPDEYSEFSNVVSCECTVGRPVASTSINTDTGKPVVKWKTVKEAEKYRVYRSTTKSGGYERIYTAITARSYTDDTAEPGITYYYKVKAQDTDTGIYSRYSKIVNSTCRLSKPVASLSVNTSSGKPVVKWQTVEGAAKYYVSRSEKKYAEYEKIYTAVTARSYTDKTAEVGTKYYYKVQAIYKTTGGNSLTSDVLSDVCVLAKPTVTLTLTSSGNPWVKWDKVDEAHGYEVWRATSKSGAYKKVKTTVSGTSFADRDVKEGTKYYYKVRAIHDNTSANSAYSSIQSITAEQIR